MKNQAIQKLMHVSTEKNQRQVKMNVFIVYSNHVPNLTDS